MNISYI